MAFKWITDMDIYEIIRRWHHRQNITFIANALDYDRKSVRKYIKFATGKGLSLEKPLPPKEQILDLLKDALESEIKRRPAEAQKLLEPFLQETSDLVNHKHIPLKPKIAFEVICERHDLEGKISYSSFKRFVRNNQIVISPQKSTCRIEVPPGSKLQIDYGYLGLLYDPLTKRRRKVYAFVAILSHSRHQYTEFVYRQTKESFVASHVRCFENFGGVPERIVLDNLKSGVIKPDLYDPVLNPAYREMAEHYKCFIDPCRPGHPQDKGKVESQIKPARQQFRKQLAMNPNLDLYQANKSIKQWCLGKHGHRIHGTTGWQPYPAFLEHEKPKLKALPNDPFEIATWKECTVHPDHYIQFNKKAYSVANAYIGKKLWVKGNDKIIRIFYQNQIIKQHVITNHYRHTAWNDFPENMKKVLDEGLPAYLQKQAGKVGPQFQKLIRRTLIPHAFINLRKAQSLINLMKKYNHPLLEKAAALALDQHLSVSPKSFILLLEKLKNESLEETQIPISLFTSEFIRPMNYFTKNQ